MRLHLGLLLHGCRLGDAIHAWRGHRDVTLTAVHDALTLELLILVHHLVEVLGGLHIFRCQRTALADLLNWSILLGLL